MNKYMQFQEDEDEEGGVSISDQAAGKDIRKLRMEDLLFQARTEGTWIVFSPLGDMWTSATTVDGLGIFYEALCRIVKERIEGEVYREGSGLAKIVDPSKIGDMALEVIVRMIRSMAAGADPLEVPSGTH